MKKIISILILSFFVFSCGSVKKSSTETEISTEIKTDATKFSNSFTLEPVDLNKPILLGKDTIYNTRVIYNNSKEVIKETKKEDLKQDIEVKEKDYSEVIETLANRFILLIGILFVLYFILSYIKNKTPLILDCTQKFRQIYN